MNRTKHNKNIKNKGKKPNVVQNRKYQIKLITQNLGTLKIFLKVFLKKEKKRKSSQVHQDKGENTNT